MKTIIFSIFALAIMFAGACQRHEVSKKKPPTLSKAEEKAARDLISAKSPYELADQDPAMAALAAADACRIPKEAAELMTAEADAASICQPFNDIALKGRLLGVESTKCGGDECEVVVSVSSLTTPKQSVKLQVKKVGGKWRVAS